MIVTLSGRLTPTQVSKIEMRLKDALFPRPEIKLGQLPYQMRYRVETGFLGGDRDNAIEIIEEVLSDKASAWDLITKVMEDDKLPLRLRRTLERARRIL